LKKKSTNVILTTFINMKWKSSYNTYHSFDVWVHCGCWCEIPFFSCWR